MRDDIVNVICLVQLYIVPEKGVEESEKERYFNPKWDLSLQK
jgi:hypothetical protein